MTHKALEELLRALAREAKTQGARMVVDFPDRRLLAAEGVEVSDHHIADISIAPDQEAARLDEASATSAASATKCPSGDSFV